MKVLHLIDHLGLGGAQTQLLDLLEARGPQIDATVWTLRDVALPSAVERLRSTRVPYRTLALSKRSPLGWFELRRRLAAEAPDLVSTHLDYGNAAGITATVSLGKSRPVLVSHIDNDPSQHYDRLTRALIRGFASKVDAFVPISESLGRAAKTAFPKARRVEIIPPGIDLQRFDPAGVDLAEVDKLRSGATRVVGTVGRLDDQKSLEVLLDATPALLDDDPETRILIVGDGPRRGDLQRQAGRLVIDHAVEFLGYRDDVATAYRAMDVFVLPSRHEGFGVVFAEAMALGIPVVGTRVVGSVDAVEDGVTGLLVEHGDPAALSGAVLRLFGEPRLKSKLIAAAQERVRRECSRETRAARIEALYDELCNGKRAR